MTTPVTSSSRVLSLIIISALQNKYAYAAERSRSECELHLSSLKNCASALTHTWNVFAFALLFTATRNLNEANICGADALKGLSHGWRGTTTSTAAGFGNLTRTYKKLKI